MRFQVMSQANAVKFSTKNRSEKTAIFSITNTNMPEVDFHKNDNINSILHLSFIVENINCIFLI